MFTRTQKAFERLLRKGGGTDEGAKGSELDSYGGKLVLPSIAVAGERSLQAI
jgi:hypothetical protein